MHTQQREMFAKSEHVTWIGYLERAYVHFIACWFTSSALHFIFNASSVRIYINKSFVRSVCDPLWKVLYKTRLLISIEWHFDGVFWNFSHLHISNWMCKYTYDNMLVSIKPKNAIGFYFSFRMVIYLHYMSVMIYFFRFNFNCLIGSHLILLAYSMTQTKKILFT